MHLIADSGSTKTTWALLGPGNTPNLIKTNGLNPYFHTLSSVEEIIRTTLIPFIPDREISAIHFYGAGCSTVDNDQLISHSLQKFFKKASIHIYHDILGAARALSGDERGIAAILGTGCNSCYYDGTNCFQEVDSLGYLFGDEGAGSNLGKRWLEKYLKKQVPGHLRQEFDDLYGFTLPDILNSLYNRPYPNRFLASFSEFLAPRQAHPFVHNLVRESFSAFVEAQLAFYRKYQPVPVSFVGSIGYYYKSILEEVMSDAEFQIGTILRDPIEGLIRYHAL
jgi:N-acetylglucosamine kinase-like BadF-type ATPase